MDKLDDAQVKYINWKEPDYNNEVTAIASTEQCNIFKRLKLL